MVITWWIVAFLYSDKTTCGDQHYKNLISKANHIDGPVFLGYMYTTLHGCNGARHVLMFVFLSYRFDKVYPGIT